MSTLSCRIQTPGLLLGLVMEFLPLFFTWVQKGSNIRTCNPIPAHHIFYPLGGQYQQNWNLNVFKSIITEVDIALRTSSAAWTEISDLAYGWSVVRQNLMQWGDTQTMHIGERIGSVVY